MPPKKENKSEVPPIVEAPPPPQQEPQMVQIQTEGFGRFQYRNGIIYQGQWQLIEGVKQKHGQGLLIVAAGTTSFEAGNEEYKGTWVNDQMEGFGVYQYTSGAIYTGEWLSGQHHGQGTYEFSDGTMYEGEWKHHQMHGEGFFIDKNANKWEGQFVDGVFQSKMQKELKMEQMLKRKEAEISQSAVSFFERFAEAFAKSDKKTFQQNLLPFFSVSEDVQLMVKDPYPKYEEKPPEKWNDIIKWTKEYTSINVLRHTSNAQILDPALILAQQFSGNGQIVQFTKSVPQRTARIVVCNYNQSNWCIVFLHDTAEPEPKKK